MNTREVADYLSIRLRKVYALVKAGEIPTARVTGKWLFPKHLIDQWVAENTDYAALDFTLRPPAPIVAGSHDPLLDFAVRRCECGLSQSPLGSLDGLRRLATGEATLAALHVRDQATGEFNTHLLRDDAGLRDFVLVEWARRQQGIIAASRNPRKLKLLVDLKRKEANVALRQAASGSHALLLQLLAERGLSLDDLRLVYPVENSETSLALAIAEERADAGLGIEAVARQFGLHFIPLIEERVDLAIRRRHYFEPPMQALLAYARTRGFTNKAASLGGYDISGLGRIVWNGR